jgi:general secretion pathway protein N
MKLLRRLLMVLLVLATVAIIAAWTCPAELAYRYFGERIAPVKLHGIAGSVWHGHADSAEVLGQNLGVLDWRLRPSSLLHGAGLAHVVLGGGDVIGNGTIEQTADRQLLLHDVEAQMPARLAAPVIGIPALELLGTIEMRVAHARLRGYTIADVSGVAFWRNAGVAGAAQARLSDLQFTFASASDGQVSGTVQDLGGPLLASGAFSASAMRYDARIKLAPRDGNAQVAEALQFVGQPQPDGSRELLIEGRLLGF